MQQKGIVSLVLAIIFGVLILGVGAFFATKFFISSKSQDPVYPGPSASVVALKPTETLPPQPARSYPTDMTDKNWIIRKGNQVLYKSSWYGFDVVRWGEWLFMVVNGNSLEKYNIKTAETQKVFNDQASGNDLYSLNLINNKLYFATGAYLSEGGVYMIKTPDAPPQKIISLMSAGIRKEKDGTYFAIGGFGDSCAGSSDINLLDTQADKTTPVVKTNYSCGKGTLEIGYSPEGFLIADSILQNEESVDGWITQLTVYPASGPSKVLISKDQMPKETQGIVYSYEDNKLAILTSSSIFLYDLNAKKLEKFMDLTKQFSFLTKFKGDVVCLEDNQSKRFAISLSSKAITEAGSECEYEGQNREVYDEKVAVFKAFDLPQEYTLSLE